MSHETMSLLGPILVAVFGFGAGAMLTFGLVADLYRVQRERSPDDR